MFTCYRCGKVISSTVKHTGTISAARMTGFDYQTGKSRNLDFPKAWHQSCYEKEERKSAALV